MGKLVVRKPMPELQVAVSASLHQRVWAAAKSAEQSMAGWVRMAILEKLEREGR
jgi:predicted HicB family RNase H-like nuclease